MADVDLDRDQDQRLEIRDPQIMRALAHPARLTIIEELAGGRTGTATELAQVCGLSPSATSYHLRALARAGLVDEAPSRGDGRERVWRTHIRGMLIDAGREESAELRDAGRALTDVFLAREEARVRHWLANSDREPPEWYSASVVSEAVLVLTAEELTQLTEQILQMIRPYTRQRRPDPPAGARRVSALLRAFPMDPHPDPPLDSPPGLASGDVKH